MKCSKAPIQKNSFGIIATHDLELAMPSKEHGIASNYSFNSKMQNGEMIYESSGLIFSF